MARLLRIEFPGACYHVINRGYNGRDIFATKGAAEVFEQCLLEAAARCGWRVHAYVIMRDHYHLALELTEPNLSVGLKWMQGTWANRFHRSHGAAGRPFQGRYKAIYVEPGPTLAQVCHSIHLNPARAKVVSMARLPEFRWSSLHWYLSGETPDFFAAETLLKQGGWANTKVGWRHYLANLAVLAEAHAQLPPGKHKSSKRGWCVGSAKFRQSLQKDLRQRGTDLKRHNLVGADPVGWRQERDRAWERKLVAGAKALGIALKPLPPRKSAPEKVQLAALMRMGTAVSNGWLADRLAMGLPASVSQYIRRFRLVEGEKDPRFAKALAKFKR